MSLFRKKKEGILESKSLDQEDIVKFLDTYLKDQTRLNRDNKGLYTTLDDVNKALDPYASTMGKTYDPEKATPEIFRLINDLLREKTKRSELWQEEGKIIERRYYIIS